MSYLLNISVWATNMNGDGNEIHLGDGQYYFSESGLIDNGTTIVDDGKGGYIINYTLSSSVPQDILDKWVTTGGASLTFKVKPDSFPKVTQIIKDLNLFNYPDGYSKLRAYALEEGWPTFDDTGKITSLICPTAPNPITNPDYLKMIIDGFNTNTKMEIHIYPNGDAIPFIVH